MSSIIEYIEELSECSICSEQFSNPIVSPCHHTFCSRCFLRYSKGKQHGEEVVCPLCRTRFKLPSEKLPRNIYLEKLVSISQFIKDDKLLEKGYTDTPELLLREWFSSLPAMLSKEEKDICSNVAEVEALVKARETQMKVLIEAKTKEVLEHLGSIKLRKIEEIDIAKNEANRTLQTLSERKLVNQKQLSDDCLHYIDSFKKILSSSLSNISIKFKAPDSAFDILTCKDVASKEAPPMSSKEAPQIYSTKPEVNIIGSIEVSEEQDCKSFWSTYSYKHSDLKFIGCIRCPNSSPAVLGMAVLDSSLFIIQSLSPQLHEYNIDNMELRKVIHADFVHNAVDMASYECRRCLYIADSYDNTIHCVQFSSKERNMSDTLRWSLGDDEPSGISVNYRKQEGNLAVVIVTCMYSQKICEFDSFGVPRRFVYLQPEITHPHHALLGEFDELIICHGYWSTDPLHRVCAVNGNGKVLQSYGDVPGDCKDSFNQPSYMLLDKAGHLIVADNGNNRVILLTASLLYSRELLSASSNQLRLRAPHRLCLDDRRRYLFVAENIINGRILVFSL